MDKFICAICGKSFDNIYDHLISNDDDVHNSHARKLQDEFIKPQDSRPKCFCGGDIKAFMSYVSESYIVECVKCSYIVSER